MVERNRRVIHHTITTVTKVASRLSFSLNLQTVEDRQGKPYFKSAFKCHLKAIQIQIYSHAQNSTKKLKKSESKVSLFYCKLHSAATLLMNE